MEDAKAETGPLYHQALSDLDALSAALIAANRQIEALTQELHERENGEGETTSRRLSELQAQALSIKVDELSDELDRANALVTRLRREAADASAKLKVADEKASDFAVQKADLEQRLEDATEASARAERELKRLQASSHSAHADVDVKVLVLEKEVQMLRLTLSETKAELKLVEAEARTSCILLRETEMLREALQSSEAKAASAQVTLQAATLSAECGAAALIGTDRVFCAKAAVSELAQKAGLLELSARSASDIESRRLEAENGMLRRLLEEARAEAREEHGKCGGVDCGRRECVGKKVFQKERRVPCGAGSQSGADRVPALQRELSNAHKGTKAQETKVEELKRFVEVLEDEKKQLNIQLTQDIQDSKTALVKELQKFIEHKEKEFEKKQRDLLAEAEWGFRTRISRAEFLVDGSDIWASLCSFGRSQRYSWRYSHNPQFIKSSLEELIELSIATRPCSPETETFTA